MNVSKKKTLNFALIVSLILSLFLPQIAFAKEVRGNESNPTLTIHKFEQETGTKPGEEGTGLPGQTAKGKPVDGVMFTLKQTHKYDPNGGENGEGSWEPITNGKTIHKETVKGKVVFTKADGLELGRYQVTETDGPAHVILNPEPFYVDVPMTSKDGTTLNYDVHVYPKNETVRSAVELVKKDEDGNALPGAVFKLFNEDGTSAKGKNGEISELTTGQDGKIKVDGLGQGKYYFQEIKAPEGYALNTTKIPFEVKKSGKNQQDVVVEWTPVKGFVNKKGEVINYITPKIDKDAEGKKHIYMDRDKEYKYNLSIQTPKDINTYKRIGVTDTLDERLSFINDGSIADGWTVEGTDKSNIIFKQNGQTLSWEVKDLSQLKPGQEIKITFTAKIKPDAELKDGEIGIDNTAKLHFDNNKGSFTVPEKPAKPEEPSVVTPTEGGLKVIKVDASDNAMELEGAEFKLTDMKGHVIDTSNSGNVVKVNGKAFNGKLENLTTDKKGKFSITGLTPGKYQLHETKAPTYTDDGGNKKSYRLLSKPVEVKVENDKVLEYKIENSKSAWELPTTGGIGTILFTLIGLTLMAVATALYFRRKKASYSTINSKLR